MKNRYKYFVGEGVREILGNGYYRNRSSAAELPHVQAAKGRMPLTTPVESCCECNGVFAIELIGSLPALNLGAV